MYQQVTIDGLEQLTKALAMAGPEVEQGLKDISKATGQKLIREVKPRIPVGPTGNLRNTLRSSRLRKGVRVAMGTKRKTPYSGFVEFGGSFNPRGAGSRLSISRPFRSGGRYFVPAVKKRRKEAAATYMRFLRKYVKKKFG